MGNALARFPFALYKTDSLYKRLAAAMLDWAACQRLFHSFMPFSLPGDGICGRSE